MPQMQKQKTPKENLCGKQAIIHHASIIHNDDTLITSHGWCMRYLTVIFHDMIQDDTWELRVLFLTANLPRNNHTHPPSPNETYETYPAAKPRVGSFAAQWTQMLWAPGVLGIKAKTFLFGVVGLGPQPSRHPIVGTSSQTKWTVPNMDIYIYM